MQPQSRFRLVIKLAIWTFIFIKKYQYAKIINKLELRYILFTYFCLKLKLMRNIVMLFAFSLSVVLCSCSGINSGKAQQEQVLEHGKVIPKVICKKDVTHSYALYLPTGYAEGKMFPLIIAFDSHGSGSKPVELFKEQAEKYGYILVGSNVSKNGTSWEATATHYDILLADVLDRFGIDKRRIYTCGFSGGSRVASTVAITKGGIAGVIGCSAGFPQVKEPKIGRAHV